MSDRTAIIISWVFIILLSTVSAMAIQPHFVNDGFTVVDEDEHLFIEVGLITTEDILQNNNFNEWSVEDKELLCLMMGVTVDPSSYDQSFVDMIDDAPRHVLETYIDLPENAGY